MSTELQPGQKLANRRFVLREKIGSGGMGEVWLAKDERLNESVALKFLPSEIAADAAALDDLRRETSRSRKLAHANIVRIHDLHDEADGRPFIVMEYVDGPTLTALRVQQPGRVLSWEYLQPLLRQLCAALNYAHGEKVVHRDLKPANVMIDSKGRLKLADFGLAAVANHSMSRISVQFSTSGTLSYMSPQQLTGERPQATDDIYSLGATLYELLTSKPPFYSGDITHQVLRKPPEPMAARLAALGIKNEIPAKVAELVMACLAKEPGQRPQSAGAVAEWIGLGTGAKPPHESPGVAKGFGRKLAGVALALLVMAGGFWLGQTSHRRDHANQPAATNQVVQQKADVETVANARGGLLLTTEPAGARVMLGGEDAQTSPANFKGIKIGKYPLRIELEGYEAVSQEIEIKANQFANLGTIPLVRQTGMVRVESQPSGARVEADGQVLGATPLDLRPPTGTAAYTLKLDGYKAASVSGIVANGTTLKLSANLVKGYPMMDAPYENSLGMKFVPVPGTKVLFCVWLTRVQDFSAFVNDTGYNATEGMYSLRNDGWKQRGDTWKSPGFVQGPTHPVCGVSWDDAQAFCRWLTAKERGNGLIAESQSYLLPTDAEWSMAVGLNELREGTPSMKDGKIRGVYPWGTQWPPPAGVGNYAGTEAADGNWPRNDQTIAGYRDGFARTSPVGSFAANRFGLLDMGGNVWEWCEDWYDNNHAARVLRGASWDVNGAAGALSACRGKFTSGSRNVSNGIRCVLVADGVAR